MFLRNVSICEYSTVLVEGNERDRERPNEIDTTLAKSKTIATSSFVIFTVLVNARSPLKTREVNQDSETQSNSIQYGKKGESEIRLWLCPCQTINFILYPFISNANHSKSLKLVGSMN